MKHNKKRNTAFLYESLIKELTKAVIKKDNAKKHTILLIIKENFYKHSILWKELQLYKSIIENKDSMTKEFTDRFLFETKKDYNTLDRKKVFNEQTKLISQINQKLSNSVFKNFISNYKDIATIGSWFQDNTSNVKNRLIVETQVRSVLLPTKTQKKEMKHIDNLTYKTFVQKFNETYKRTLKENQKTLLTNYITSFSDNGLGLKVFVNEEVTVIKNKIHEIINTDVHTDNKEKLSQVLNVLENFNKRPLDEKMVKKLFYIQDLIGEF